MLTTQISCSGVVWSLSSHFLTFKTSKGPDSDIPGQSPFSRLNVIYPGPDLHHDKKSWDTLAKPDFYSFSNASPELYRFFSLGSCWHNVLPFHPLHNSVYFSASVPWHPTHSSSALLLLWYQHCLIHCILVSTALLLRARDKCSPKGLQAMRILKNTPPPIFSQVSQYTHSGDFK